MRASFVLPLVMMVVWSSAGGSLTRILGVQCTAVAGAAHRFAVSKHSSSVWLQSAA